MRNRVLGLLGAVTVAAVPVLMVACGGGSSDHSIFDAGTPTGTTVDSGGGTIGDDQSDATTPSITVTGNGGGPNDSGGGTVDCDATPLACVPQVCGDAVIEPGETCDDGNAVSGDGCSSTCQLEGDYYACVAGQPCVDTRNCDELVEAGVIKAGSDSGCSAPVKVPVCGDGFLDPGEACDTGSDVGTAASGCAADCSAAFEGYVCPTAGQNCTNTWICGDGKIEGSEQCDEGPGNQTAGCSAATATPACAVTPGWTCTIPGVPCVATKCGDGIVAGSEQCDVGTHTQAGCDATCHLAAVTTVTAPSATTQPSTVVTNYACSYASPNPGYETCAPTTCGNKKVEGTEQCDDGNTKAYDGCSANCQLEPSCLNNAGTPDGTCVAVCGDGLVFDFDGEQCDDGNTLNGDGCSSTCQQEPGYKCTITTPSTLPATVDVPVVYRDMLYYNTTTPTADVPYAHPDFEHYSGSGTTGLVKSALVNGVPIFAKNGGGPQLTSAADFTDWYADVINPDGVTPALTKPRGMRVDGQQIRMTLVNGAYVFDSNCDAPYSYGRKSDGTCATSGTELGGFFPLNGKGWDDPAGANAGQVSNGDNFSFTTQFRYYFTFSAAAAASATPPTLAFSGDDDLWIFLANQLALDLGGLHSAESGTLVLNTAMATSLGLVDQHVYEVDLFNAERHTSASNFKLTLTGFVKKVSSCVTVCGDGVRTPNELCDDNTAPSPLPAGQTVDDYNTNDGDYGTCTLSCTLGPYCGDKTVTKPEEVCDNGTNQTPYATSAAAALASCAPGCVEPAYCGDDKVQGSYGELCDNGTANSDTAYGGCTTKCALGPRCGDKVVQTANGEVCDNGFNATPYVATLASDSCAPGCKLPAYCGNGTVDVPYEICDNGASNSNAGAYDSCSTSCKLGPHCGDGIVQSPQEQCDDGNQKSGDGCSAGCQTESNGVR